MKFSEIKESLTANVLDPKSSDPEVEIAGFGVLTLSLLKKRIQSKIADLNRLFDENPESVKNELESGALPHFIKAYVEAQQQLHPQATTESYTALLKHLKEGVPLCDSIFRYQSDAYFETLNLAKSLYRAGLIENLDWESIEMLESDIGEKVKLKGLGEVYLDVPYMETVEESEQLDEILPVIGAMAGRAIAGAGASAATRAAAGLAGRAVGSKVQSALDDNDLDPTDSASKDDPVDTVTVDVPLMIRMLEYAREDAKTDMDLHDVADKMIELSKKGTLTMDNYAEIVGQEVMNIEEAPGDIRKALAGIAIIASLWGVNKYVAQQAYDASPQLQQLITLHQEAQAAGNKTAAEHYADRIEQQKLRIDLGKGEVMGKDGRPVAVKKFGEAEYQGKDVELNKPKRGGSKKFYVYVKNPKTGKIKKVSFGAKSGGGNLAVKLKDPKARKAFADRHNCEQKKDKTSAGYWSCRLPRYAKSLGLSGGGTWW